MLIKLFLIIILSVLPAFAETNSSQINKMDQNFYIIRPTGIGMINIGMKLSDVRRKFPKLKFERTSDGDGVALISVKNGNEALMTLYAGEEDREAPINWSRKIEVIETFNFLFHTVEGIHPGSLLTDVEKVYGKLNTIGLSEIECRQFAKFKKQPSGMIFRIDYCGEFVGDSRTTNKFKKNCKLFSILIRKE